MTDPYKEAFDELTFLIETNWQRMEGDVLVDVDPMKWLKDTLIPKTFVREVEEKLHRIERYPLAARIVVDEKNINFNEGVSAFSQALLESDVSGNK